MTLVSLLDLWHTPPRVGSVRESETVVESGLVQLAGTECVPVGAGPFPYVVFVHGSGPVDRDENVPGQRLDVFNALARKLADVGIASFRYDKRGCGASTGDFYGAGFADLVSDARASVRAVAGFQSCSEVFVVAHSEGCVIAPLVARDVPELVSGLALLCPFLPPLEPILLRQAQRVASELQEGSALSRTFLRVLRLGRWDPVRMQRSVIERVRASSKPTVRVGPRRIPAKWLRELLELDSRVFEGVECPVLLVGAEKDLQCDPRDVEKIRDLLSVPVEAHVVSDLTHFLRLDPGAPSLLQAHQLLKAGIASSVSDVVAAWLTKRRHPGEAQLEPELDNAP